MEDDDEDVGAKGQTHIKRITDQLLTTLRKHNTLIGEWKGTFWGASKVTINYDGHFSINGEGKGKGKGTNEGEGQIWLNLKETTLNCKREPQHADEKTNDYFGTFKPETSTIEIVKQQNGATKNLTKLKKTRDLGMEEP